MLKKYSLKLQEDDDAIAFSWLSDVLDLCGFGRLTLDDLEKRYRLQKEKGMKWYSYLFTLKE
jgi:hypothetical protein